MARATLNDQTAETAATKRTITVLLQRKLDAGAHTQSHSTCADPAVVLAGAGPGREIDVLAADRGHLTVSGCVIEPLEQLVGLSG